MQRNVEAKAELVTVNKVKSQVVMLFKRVWTKHCMSTGECQRSRKTQQGQKHS